jgi:hypothetical protein
MTSTHRGGRGSPSAAAAAGRTVFLVRHPFRHTYSTQVRAIGRRKLRSCGLGGLLAALLALAFIAVGAPALASGAPDAPRAAGTAHATCASGGEGTTEIDAGRDVALGSLVLLGARLTVRDRPDAFNRHGYKVPVTLPEGVTATLSVPSAFRSRVGLVFTHRAQDRAWRSGVSGADRAVRFTACSAGAEAGRSGWGGRTRRRPSPLREAHLRVAGGPTVRRRVPLGGRC